MQTTGSIVLPPLYFAPLSWYRALAHAERAVIDTSMRADRRYKAVHRTLIAGRAEAASCLNPEQEECQTLTAAICKFAAHTPLSSVLISEHDRWWDKHARTIATVYGRTPYYEYLWPRFGALLNDSLPGTPLVDLTLSIDAAVREILSIDTPVSVPMDDSYDDFVRPAVSAFRGGEFEGISIIGALFTLGPEETRELVYRG